MYNYFVLGVENNMASVVVREGEPIEKALKRFQKVAASSKAEARKREYHLSKKEKRIYKQKQNKKFG
ncbi:30S ribosomal protein S21 [Spiroplasma chinense]|uniref:Small ribosomal subunit protein bS21 n=2 Tax=Spiroplasma chinense TaxID=216932 RepID=A0A5B9Y3U2_9MOLU|nr:30S ribosomal protein S21 [Spiroplasma chinense]